MNAAKLNHAVIHAQALIWLSRNASEYTWAIDLDINVIGKEESYILRPDIVGIKDKQNHVFVEISDWTISKDMNKKKKSYADAGIPIYIIFDIKKRAVLQFSLDDAGTYQPLDIFHGTDRVYDVLNQA